MSTALAPKIAEPPTVVSTLREALAMISMTPQVHQLFEVMLDELDYKDSQLAQKNSLIAALKTANSELQEVVALLAQDDGSMVLH